MKVSGRIYSSGTTITHDLSDTGSTPHRFYDMTPLQGTFTPNVAKGYGLMKYGEESLVSSQIPISLITESSSVPINYAFGGSANGYTSFIIY